MASYSPQEALPPKFSRVPLVDVFVTICFLRERVVSPLPNPPLFSAGLGTVHGRVQYWRDVVVFSSTADEPGSAVLHTLQTLQRCLRKAVYQRIRVVEACNNKRVYQGFARIISDD